MAQQSGPKSTEGKAASSRNAQTHGLTNLNPVVTEADRPEFNALRDHLFHAIQPVGYLQHLAARRLVNSAWNMQRCQKLENLLMESIDGVDPLTATCRSSSARGVRRSYLRM